MQRIIPWLIGAFTVACASPHTDLVSIDFERPEARAHFSVSDESDWRMGDDDERGAVLELVGGGAYQPPFRSPRRLALLNSPEVGDFDLEVDLRQTGREYGHRDLVLVFGFQSASRYYYVHLATTPDEHAHNIFLVLDAERRRVGEIPAHGIEWGDVWHRVRIERRTGPGIIRVYFDDSSEPVLQATDTNLMRGRVGFGSFDDEGRFDQLVLRSADAAQVATSDQSPFEVTKSE